MAWIELHQSLMTHRKTLALADLLGLKPVYVVGHLAALWAWALDNAPEGDLSGVSPRTIARVVEWDREPEEFVSALVKVGFLDQGQDDDQLTIHNWGEYAGKLIDRRQANAERQRNYRQRTTPSGNARYVTVTSPSRHHNVTGLPDPTGPNRTQPDHIADANASALAAGTSSERPDSPAPTPKKNKYHLPEDFAALETLSGYVTRNHARAVEIIAATCQEAGVSPRAIVAQFAEYYQGNRLRHGWSDPVQALRRTIAIQIARAQGRSPPPGNGQHSNSHSGDRHGEPGRHPETHSCQAISDAELDRRRIANQQRRLDRLSGVPGQRLDEPESAGGTS